MENKPYLSPILNLDRDFYIDIKVPRSRPFAPFSGILDAFDLNSDLRAFYIFQFIFFLRFYWSWQQ